MNFNNITICAFTSGDRVAETHDGERTEFTLDMASPLTTVLSETTRGQTTSYLYGLGLVAQTKGPNPTEYLLADGLGSVRQNVDQGMVVRAAQTFDPYGNPFQQVAGANYSQST